MKHQQAKTCTAQNSFDTSATWNARGQSLVNGLARFVSRCQWISFACCFPRLVLGRTCLLDAGRDWFGSGPHIDVQLRHNLRWQTDASGHFVRHGTRHESLYLPKPCEVKPIFALSSTGFNRMSVAFRSLDTGNCWHRCGPAT